MSYSITMNNIAIVSGQITGSFRPYPGSNRKNLCMADLAVRRLSGCTDYIPLTISTKTAAFMQNHTRQNIWTAGRFISCRYYDQEGTHLNLSLLSYTYAFLDHPQKDENLIFLDGYISKPPVFRITPRGRKITELTVAINYPCLATDYIPCICWNRNALEASRFTCGTHVHAWGRIQSRKYLKKINEWETQIKTAYKISVWKIVLPDIQPALLSQK